MPHVLYIPITSLDLRYLTNRKMQGNSPTLHSKKLTSFLGQLLGEEAQSNNLVYFKISIRYIDTIELFF